MSIDLNTGFVHFLVLVFCVDFYDVLHFSLQLARFVHPDAFTGDNRAFMLTPSHFNLICLIMVRPHTKDTWP